jgi:hypothetical protein
MTVQPILDAELIIATALRNALAPFVGTFNDRPKVYESLAEQGAPKPLLVFQFQADITPDWRVGSAGASALITVKSLAEDSDSARQLLKSASAGMSTLYYPGYSVTARYVRSPKIPQFGNVFTSAHTWRISIERN